MKSVRDIIAEKNFSPVEKLVDLYEELETTYRDSLKELSEKNPLLDSHARENQKIRERVLSSVMKFKQQEDAHVLKLAELENQKGNQKEGSQGVILQHVRKELPNGKVVIEKVLVEQGKEEEEAVARD